MGWRRWQWRRRWQRRCETLYDLDIEAPKIAEKAGLERLLRARAVCDRPRFIDALEAVARRALAP